MKLLSAIRRPRHQNPANKHRSFERHACAIEAHLTMEGRQYEAKGVIMDISRQGILFRPRSLFIMRLENQTVALRLGDRELRGHVVNTTPRGYGLNFTETLEQDFLDDILAVHDV